MNLKEMYTDFLEKGELQTFMPTSTGVWEKDKTEFIEIYNILAKSATDINNFEEEMEEEI